VAGVALGRIQVSFFVPGMALVALGWVWWRAWSSLTVRDAVALCVAGVTSTFVLHGRRGTWRHPPSFCNGRRGAWRHPPSFCVAGMALATFTFVLRARRFWHGLLHEAFTPCPCEPLRRGGVIYILDNKYRTANYSGFPMSRRACTERAGGQDFCPNWPRGSAIGTVHMHNIVRAATFFMAQEKELCYWAGVWEPKGLLEQLKPITEAPVRNRTFNNLEACCAMHALILYFEIF